MDRIGDGDQSVKKYVAVVLAFIVAASLLVVLTIFAINMLTATGDLNRLMAQWSKNNSSRDSIIVQYLETGDDQLFLLTNLSHLHKKGLKM